MNINDFQNLNFTFIGNHTNIQGDLSFQGNVVINGSIKGSLQMGPSSQLIIESSAHIEGDIFAHDIEVSGEVNGRIESSGTVIVKSSAIISGSLNAVQFKIAPGAILNIQGNTQEAKL